MISSEVVVLARLTADPHPALRAIVAAAAVRPGMKPARAVVLGDEYRDRGTRDGSMIAVEVLGAFSILTLLLAASGVFAVIGQSVTQRTHEFGIRMAIGGTPQRVLGMVLARETKLIALGMTVGLVFTMALTRALFAELIRLNAIVPSRWLAAVLLSMAVTAMAVACATYRIVRLEPAAVLRRP